MSTTLTAVIISARLLAGDGPTDNLVRNENADNADIGNTINGVNKLFNCQNFPLVPAPGGIQTVVQDGAITTAFTENDPTGQVTTTTAPVSTLYFTYFFYLFPDATWTEFVTGALEVLNVSTGIPATDITLVPEGLLPAVKSYSVARFCMRVATQTGLWYNQKLQEREEDRESVSKKFLQMGQEWNKQGNAQRDGFYMGAGTQLQPAMSIVEFVPRDWTPRR